MKPLRLLIAVVILAGFGAAIWYSQKNPPKPETTTETKTVKVLNLKEDQIQKVRVVHANGETLELKRGDNGKWQMTEPAPYRVDESNANSLVSTLSSLDADQVVAENNSDWQSYGLETGKFTVTVSTKDGKDHKLTVGDEAPASSVIYARLAGDNRLFALSSYMKSSLGKTAPDLRDKRLLPLESDKLTRLTITNKNGTVEFARTGKGWEISKPRALRADSFAVDDLVRAAETAYDSVLAEDEKGAAKYSVSSPYATLEAASAAGTQRLVIGEQKGKEKDATTTYFAKTTAMPGVFKITQTNAESFNKKLDQFRNGRIIELGADDPAKLEVRDGDLRLTLEKKGDRWQAGAKQPPGEKVQSLLGLLRRMQAKAYPSDDAAAQAKYGLDKATVEVKAGNERVRFSSSADKAFAARDGDPTTYEIDPADLKELQKSISELK